MQNYVKVCDHIPYFKIIINVFFIKLFIYFKGYLLKTKNIYGLP